MKPEDRPWPPPLTEQPPADRYCDLVMKGGVASGVVYPWAVLELARHYRLRSIGGTSVGAVAAALAAACEYGRCHGVEQPFEVLRRLPARLAEDRHHEANRERHAQGLPPLPRQGEPGPTLMLRLFQPAAAGQRLFSLLLGLLRDLQPPEGGRGRGLLRSLGRLLLQTARSYGLGDALLLASLPALAAATAVARYGLAAMLLVAACVLLLGGWAWGVWALRRLRAELQQGLLRNDLGLCRGSTQKGSDTEGFTDWMHRGIQRAAGLGRDDPPLSFAQLLRAPRPGPGDGKPGIDLRMMSTVLSQGRPFQLPLREAAGEPALYFRAVEWRRFFPRSVIAQLLRVSRRCEHPAPAGHPGLRLLRLPEDELPVLVAARMSMSFPLLFSMLPAWQLDASPQPAGLAPQLRRVWVSDGGVTANFPLHLFDAAQPRWPTFGLWLDRRQRDPDATGLHAEDPVWMPRHGEPEAPFWLRGVPGAALEPGETKGLLKTVAGLLGGFVDTWMEWNERSSLRQPSHRARVLRIALRPEEGPLAIQMPARTLLRMAHEYGTAAGQLLVQRYRHEGEWQAHQALRARVWLRGLRERLRDYRGRLQADGGHASPLADLLQPSPEDQALQQAAEACAQLGEQLDALPQLAQPPLQPPAELRLRAPL